MSLFAVVKSTYIEDYYKIDRITSLHATAEDAWDFAVSDIMAAFNENYEAWVSSRASHLAAEKFKAEIAAAYEEYREIGKQCPKYKGAPNDKHALELHRTRKQEWNKKRNQWHDDRSKFDIEVVNPYAAEMVSKIKAAELTAENYEEMCNWKSSDYWLVNVVPVELDTALDI